MSAFDCRYARGWASVVAAEATGIGPKDPIYGFAIGEMYVG